MNSDSSGPITQTEALASLAEIDHFTDRIRKTIAYGCSAPLLILWGAIWLLGFAVTQFHPESMNRLWGVLDLAGIAGSVWFGAWFRHSPIRSPHSGRIGLSWLVLLGYGALWVVLLIPWGLPVGGLAYVSVMSRRIAAFWSTVPMFGYVIMGLWLGRFFLWLGLAVTVVTLAGFYLLPAYFYLSMAVGGGGALMVAGIFIRLRWR